MLNGVLLIGVPMAALLMAAMYILSKTKPQTHGPGGPSFHNRREPREPASRTSTSPRRRRRQTSENGIRQTTEFSSPALPEDDQCQICFEDAESVQIVKLYPCQHSDICLSCVTKLLLSDHRECPFCRREFSGFIDIQSGEVFG